MMQQPLRLMMLECANGGLNLIDREVYGSTVDDE